MSSKVIWGEMTWPEIGEASEQQRVVLLPVGVIEDHGLHLPVDVDVVLAETVCRRGAEAMPDRAIVAPTIAHGYTPHHMDFPGTITVSARVFIDYCLDVCKSIAYHGFTKVLVVNGHGGNVSALDMVAKIATLEAGVFCASVSHWALEPVKRTAQALSESPPAGGMVHADEYETSLYMAIRPELVQMEKAVQEIGIPESRYFWVDLINSGDRFTSAGFMEPWSAYTKSGVIGNPQAASREKGERLLMAAVEGLVELVDEMRERPLATGQDRHGRSSSRIVKRDPRVAPW
jgi:creatinine amidohydrolase